MNVAETLHQQSVMSLEISGNGRTFSIQRTRYRGPVHFNYSDVLYSRAAK